MPLKNGLNHKKKQLNNMEITGKIHSIGETKTFGQSFDKREFVLFIENERNSDWSDYVKLELTQDRCNLINGLNVGDTLKAAINLKGRLWTNPKGEEVCFNTIEAWKIDIVEKANQTQSQPPEQSAPQSGENNEMPF